MKVTKFIVTQTMQVKQYHPLNLQIEFEVDESEMADIKIKIQQANKLVYNSLRAEIYRERMNDPEMTIVEVRDRYSRFIERHLSTDYFKDDDKEETMDKDGGQDE